MANQVSKPLFTREYDISTDFKPEPGSAYIYGVTPEDRSEFAIDLQLRCPDVTFVELREAEKFVFESDVDGHERVSVRRRASIESFIGAIQGNTIYIDITGLGHNAWAPLVKVCIESGRGIRAVYLEPASYALSASPRLGEIYDLSERIEGIEPIPLFTNLEDRADNLITFIPLLGFEGTRFSHMLEEVQPRERKTFPIIGVPGFRPEYPFEAYLGNGGPLERTGAYLNVRYAKSNCPFSLFYALENLAESHPRDQLKIGLIGTKPHALGAIMFSLVNENVEIVYDHVLRRPKRTSGTLKCLVYGLSEFLPLPLSARAT